ncbi:MAG: hypothetical protein EBR82_25350 [Caulobacteraceae bacterium]|nr:hypothetical protein [Caulobacteraceae bacterium]
MPSNNNSNPSRLANDRLAELLREVDQKLESARPLLSEIEPHEAFLRDTGLQIDNLLFLLTYLSERIQNEAIDAMKVADHDLDMEANGRSPSVDISNQP